MPDGDEIEFNHIEAMAATRHLVLGDVSRRLMNVEQHFDSCDAECDRALAEIWRLARWIEARVQRNEAP